MDPFWGFKYSEYVGSGVDTFGRDTRWVSCLLSQHIFYWGERWGVHRTSEFDLRQLGVSKDDRVAAELLLLRLIGLDVSEL